MRFPIIVRLTVEGWLVFSKVFVLCPLCLAVYLLFLLANNLFSLFLPLTKAHVIQIVK